MRMVLVVLAILTTIGMIETKSSGGLLEWAIIIAGTVSAVSYML